MTKKNAATATQADAFDAGATPAPATEEAPPEVKAVPAATQQVQDSHGVIAKARAMVVTNPAEYVVAAELLQNMRGGYKRMEEERLGITRPMDAAKERVMAFFRPHLDALTEAGNTLRGKLNDYDAEQKRIADEARAKAEAEADRQRKEAQRKADEERAEAQRKADAQRAEAERLRREQEAEEKRVRDEKAAAEKAQREAEEAQRRGDAEAAAAAQRDKEAADQRARDAQAASDAAAKAAAKADAKADTAVARGEQRAQAQESVAVSVVAPVITSVAPKVAGIARRLVWKWKVTDESKIGRVYLAIDEAKIEKLVKALGKDAEVTVGGIECWQENDISARSK
jgi:DNA repair exonuclease SbcCD ATPase subunit